MYTQQHTRTSYKSNIYNVGKKQNLCTIAIQLAGTESTRHEPKLFLLLKLLSLTVNEVINKIFLSCCVSGYGVHACTTYYVCRIIGEVYSVELIFLLKNEN